MKTPKEYICDAFDFRLDQLQKVEDDAVKDKNWKRAEYACRKAKSILEGRVIAVEALKKYDLQENDLQEKLNELVVEQVVFDQNNYKAAVDELQAKLIEEEREQFVEENDLAPPTTSHWRNGRWID